MLLWGALLALLLSARVPAAQAAIAMENCDSCHGLLKGLKEAGNTQKACVGCHQQVAGETIKTLDRVRVPVVYNVNQPVLSLAGGNFHFVDKDAGERKGHNVGGIAPADSKLGPLPPGYSRGSDPSRVGFNPRKPMACSGSNGCHGDRNIEDPLAAVSGAHHGKGVPVDGSSTARSYRYLRITSDERGVAGLEDPDWGRRSTPKVHNEYVPSLNRVCSGCHGDFHGPGSSWPGFRHSTGGRLPERGEFALYRVYSLDAPVARRDVPAASSEEVRAGSDEMTCLTCHVAHAGPYDHALRWNYESIFTGSGGKGGCFICHTSKAR